MEAIQQQVNAVVEEIALLKGEIIGIKMQHASFHQSSVDKSTADEARFAEAAKKVASIEEKMGSIASGIRPGSSGSFGKPKPLIEAKQVVVSTFAGSMMDSRSKFLE